jgi:Lysozyme like domain
MERPSVKHTDADCGEAKVTAWGSPAIATIAKAAGFSGDALHDAVALALAASGGADHYRYNPISLPGAERQGLWAIRVDEVPPDRIVDLFNANHCAAIARELWVASSKSFGWHPAWVSGAAAEVRPAVVLHLSGKGRRNGPLSGREFHTQVRGISAVAEQLAQALDTGTVPNV